MDSVRENSLDAILKVVEALPTDHRVRDLGEISHLRHRRRRSIRLARSEDDRAAVLLRFAKQREQRRLAGDAGQVPELERAAVQQRIDDEDNSRLVLNVELVDERFLEQLDIGGSEIGLREHGAIYAALCPGIEGSDPEVCNTCRGFVRAS